ncbi:N-acetyl-anhydromuranmyl-L-alanine amidase [Duganella sp. Leaf126]|uniref:1,6-anhydro-N-acetylmuramyl-L-alanine amidase AmpD n=1 Tax=Duganella sp. Leaf126 TaxID=1736266 RepID=UPI0006F1DE9A|nr:1,6-anhydro-N-acetylmuramyl-L-alanine amidase AmpD [Duganella sp. Leaf126]KQQ47345.1 N-acetyl-anhydromuranmyl-L-alanine amidase [Duganella sp. Leaf126]
MTARAAKAANAAIAAIDAGGWWPAAARYDSPFIDERPDPHDISLIVIHNIGLPGGRAGGPHVSDLFTGRLDYNIDPSLADLRGLRVSSHFFIRRDGRVVQYAPAGARAWHAGVSVFRERVKCNDFSIGIELEGNDRTPFEAAQYAALADLTGALLARYPITDIQGHEHVAPGRKTDPGAFFDWQRYADCSPLLVPANPGLRVVKGLPQSQ